MLVRNERTCERDTLEGVTLRVNTWKTKGSWRVDWEGRQVQKARLQQARSASFRLALSTAVGTFAQNLKADGRLDPNARPQSELCANHEQVSMYKHVHGAETGRPV